MSKSRSSGIATTQLEEIGADLPRTADRGGISNTSLRAKVLSGTRPWAGPELLHQLAGTSHPLQSAVEASHATSSWAPEGREERSAQAPVHSNRNHASHPSDPEDGVRRETHRHQSAQGHNLHRACREGLHSGECGGLRDRRITEVSAGPRPRRQYLPVGISEAVILRVARQHGIGKKMGRAIIFSPDDIEKLYEALPSCSRSSGDQSRRARVIRGSIGGIRVEESTGTSDRRTADEIRAKREAKIHRGQIYGREATATFAEAAVSYLESGGSRQFIEPVIKYWGTKPLAKIDYSEIESGSLKVYPKAAPSTRNRQFFTPTMAVLNHAALHGLCSVPVARDQSRLPARSDGSRRRRQRA